MQHDIKCHAPEGCIYPDCTESEMDTICDRCEHNHCRCAECQERREND